MPKVNRQTAWFIRSQCEAEIRVSITDGCFSFTSVHQCLISREITLPATLASGFVFPFTVHSVICVNSVLGEAICAGLHITPRIQARRETVIKPSHSVDL